jgi:pimeloyl-ACP methyl ester carboxylesterase
MSEIRHQKIQTNGINLHIADAGEGPAVLLCHGFPESWYSWRHQLPALAEAGYRAIAPDMRGYGQSDAPEAIESYTILHLVGDMVGLLDALGIDDAVLVGHDWGAMVAWTGAQLRPDRFRAVVGMSVPYVPRTPIRPLDAMKAMAGDRFMYILYFQEPGVAEAELEADVTATMRRFLFAASGEGTFRADLPKTAKFLDGAPEPDGLPAWLSPEDLAFYAAEFERTGFRGGLNWYRNFDRNWELTGAFAGRPIEVPAYFVGGLKDPVVTGGGDEPSPMVQLLETTVPTLRGKTLIPGAGHWNQQEAPAETNKALIEFLNSL